MIYFSLQVGKTPLQLAARGSYVGIVDMIIKAERYKDGLQNEAVGIQTCCGQYHHCFYGGPCTAFTGGSGRVNSVSQPT